MWEIRRRMWRWRGRGGAGDGGCWAGFYGETVAGSEAGDFAEWVAGVAESFAGIVRWLVAHPFRGEVFPSTGANGDGAMETIRPEGLSYKTRFSRFGGLRDFAWREGLEVGPFDRDADGNFAVLHLIDVFGAGIVGEPVFAFHVFAIRFKHIERQTTRAHRTEVGHPFAVGLHDFQIFLVHPEDAVEERVLAVERLGMNFKNVAVDFVDFFAAQEFHVV